MDGYYASTNRLLKEQCLRLKKAVDKLNEQSSPEQVKDTGCTASKECQKDRSEGLIPSLEVNVCVNIFKRFQGGRIY